MNYLDLNRKPTRPYDFLNRYFVLAVLIFVGILYQQQDHLVEIFEGRYIPGYGSIYSFPGEVTPSNEKTSEQALTAFNRPWVNLVLKEQFARKKNKEFAEKDKKAFLETVSFDPTLHQIMNDLISEMPFTPRRYRSTSHQFRLLNHYMYASNLPIRISAGFGVRIKRNGDQKIRFLPGVQAVIGQVEVQRKKDNATLVILDRLDRINTGSNQHGVAFEDRREGWLILEGILYDFNKTQKLLEQNPPQYPLGGSKKESSKASLIFGQWISKTYADVNQDWKATEHFKTRLYGTAIHEARHLQDTLDPPKLTSEAKGLFKDYKSSRQRLIAEYRAYLSTLIECAQCLPEEVASLLEHLTAELKRPRNIYSIVARQVLIDLAPPNQLAQDSHLFHVLGFFANDQLVERLSSARSNARQAYERNFGKYEPTGIVFDDPAFIETAMILRERNFSRRRPF